MTLLQPSASSRNISSPCGACSSGRWSVANVVTASGSALSLTRGSRSLSRAGDSPAQSREVVVSFPRAGYACGVHAGCIRRHLMKVAAALAGGATFAAASVLAARRSRDDIRGEVAIVTGASRGLGLLLARELARHGCPLVICARDAAALERAAAGLRSEGAEVTAIACDVTGESAPRRLLETAIERYGRVDIVVSNAGIIQVGPVMDAQVSHFETALDTMALAP